MKSSRRVQMTQALLKQSLIELLEEKDLGQISIKEICERADVSRSAFYSHYGSQYELLYAIEEEIMEATRQLASQETCHDEAHTKMLLQQHFQYILDHFQSFQVFSMRGAEDYMLPRQTMQIILLPYLDRRLMQKNPPVSAGEYEHICLFSIFGCIAVVKSWIRNPARFTPQSLADEMMGYINAVVEAGRLSG